MTAFALVTGTLFRPPLQKISKAGKPYTVCTVKAGADDSGTGDFWSIICFSESAQLELLRLEAGDAVSVRGKMKLELYTANDGATKISRSIFADAALGLRPVPREKKPKAPPTERPQLERVNIVPTSTASPSDLDDDIPF
jgi:single-stranded DNA-binding protein